MCQRCVERAQDEYSQIISALRKLLGSAGKKIYEERWLNEDTRSMLGNAFMLAEVALQATTQEPFGRTELQQLRSGVMSLLMTQERVGVHDRQRSIAFAESLLKLVQREPEHGGAQGQTMEQLIREFFGEGAQVSSPFPGVTMASIDMADLFRPRAPSANEGNTSRSTTMQDQEQGGADRNQQPRPGDYGYQPPERQPNHPFPTTDEPVADEPPTPASEVRPESSGASER